MINEVKGGALSLMDGRCRRDNAQLVFESTLHVFNSSLREGTSVLGRRNEE